MTAISILEETNSRYHRQELITWWDQSKLQAARVLVVGAGALGNEVVKNLALVGVGHIEIVDMDDIEHSNLARCVFFRERHEGLFKANVLAAEAMLLNPEVTAIGHSIPVQRLGIAALTSFDIVIGALDNREARAWVNQACRKLGMYWIDGAIEGLRGLARVFGPEGACYACTLTENDYKQMSHRKSCALLAPEEMLGGKTPTNATTASIIAGVQVLEAIKYLVGEIEMMSLIGKCWVYTGDTMDTYVTRYSEDEYCLAHDKYEQLHDGQNKTRPVDLLTLMGMTGLADVAFDFEEDLVRLLPCEKCGGGEVTRTRSAFKLGGGQCDTCGSELVGDISTSLEATDSRLELTFAELGLGQSDIVTLRSASTRFHVRVKGAPHE
jgi:molybdopterin/thiamine biosynthesis adenylyltransferase